MLITRRRLHHLQCVAEHGHFGKAAEALNISQPALSKSIQMLENDLGVILLNRKRKGLELTIYGEMAIERGKLLINAEADLRHDISMLADGEIGKVKLALGAYPSVMSGYPGISKALERYPKIQFTVHVMGWRDVVTQVIERKVDIGIAEISGLQDNPMLTTELLGQHQARFICRKGHPLAKLSRVTFSQLLAYPWAATRLPPRIANGMPKELGNAGSRDLLNGDFIPAIELDVPHNLGKLIGRSDILAIAAFYMAEHELDADVIDVLPTQGIEIRTSYGFITHAGRLLSPATKNFMQAIRDQEKDIVKRENKLIARFMSRQR